MPDEPEQLDYKTPQTEAVSPDNAASGAKLFVIFFFAIVPLLGFVLLAMVIYSLLMR